MSSLVVKSFGNLTKATKLHPFLSFLAFLFLLNGSSFPLVYHIKATLVVIPLHLQLRVSRRKHLILPNASTTYQSRVQLDDLDLNMHMNNAMYAKSVDYARLKHMVSLFGLQVAPFTLEYRLFFANGGTQYIFLRELAAYEPYAIKTRLLAFSKKWFLLVHVFTTKGGKVVNCIAVSKLVLKDTKGKEKGRTWGVLEALERAQHDVKELKEQISEEEKEEGSFVFVKNGLVMDNFIRVGAEFAERMLSNEAMLRELILGNGIE